MVGFYNGDVVCPPKGVARGFLGGIARRVGLIRIPDRFIARIERDGEQDERMKKRFRSETDKEIGSNAWVM